MYLKKIYQFIIFVLILIQSDFLFAASYVGTPTMFRETTEKTGNNTEIETFANTTSPPVFTLENLKLNGSLNRSFEALPDDGIVTPTVSLSGETRIKNEEKMFIEFAYEVLFNPLITTKNVEDTEYKLLLNGGHINLELTPKFAYKITESLGFALTASYKFSFNNKINFKNEDNQDVASNNFLFSSVNIRPLAVLGAFALSYQYSYSFKLSGERDELTKSVNKQQSHTIGIIMNTGASDSQFLQIEAIIIDQELSNSGVNISFLKAVDLL